MQALLAPLRELAEYEEIRNILYKDKKIHCADRLRGVTETAYDIRSGRWLSL